MPENLINGFGLAENNNVVILTKDKEPQLSYKVDEAILLFDYINDIIDNQLVDEEIPPFIKSSICFINALEIAKGNEPMDNFEIYNL